MRMILLFLASLSSCILPAQSKLFINGAVININNGAALVIDNPDNNAIVQNGSGYIQSEGSNNRIVWTIGTGNGGNYLLPFGNATNYLPLRFSASSGSDATGQFIFSTYPTPTWKNSDFLPPGVTNINRGTTDNSANVVDRFWQLSPSGYTTKPSFTNLVFTYAEGEYAPPNTITEAALIGQRWNSALAQWDDFIPASSVNTSANTVSIALVPGNQLFSWWTLANNSTPLPLSLVSFAASAHNKTVFTSWQTASEINTDYFEVWRSPDGLRFDSVGKVGAAGASTSLLNYALTDAAPYHHTSYYRLKSIDKDAKFSWSAIVSVTMNDASTIFLYPNPVANYIVIRSSAEVAAQKPLANLFDAAGRLLQSFALTSTSQRLNTTMLPSGVYHITIGYGNELSTFSFIKK